jgi:hypothetical protein
VVLFTGEPIGKALWQLARMLDRNGYRLGGLISVICILSSIAIYGFLRFGLKNSVARLALIYVVIGIAGVVLGLQPGPCMALWVAVTVLSFFASSFSQTRHAMASLAIVFMVVPFFLLAFFTLQMAASRFFEFSFAELSLFGRLFGPMMTLVMCLVFSRVNPSSRRMSDRVSA